MADFNNLRWVNLEPTSACQLRCGHCPREDSPRDKQFMSMPLYKHLLAQVPMGCEVRLFLSGEPFLDPQLGERVRLARLHGSPTLIHTNGVGVTFSKALKVIVEHPTRISISIDGGDPSEYEKMRPPAKFSAVRKGLESLIKARDDFGSRTKIILQTIRPYPEPLEVNSGVSDLVSSVDEVYVRHPHNWAQMASVEGSAPSNYRGVCSFLKVSMSVASDGAVVPCCAVLNKEHIMGDATQWPLEHIWKTAHDRFRKAQENRDPLPVCSDCERYGVKGYQV